MVTTIFPADRDDARTLARALLDAAGPERRDEVTTVTQGALGIAYEVPEDLAATVLGTTGKAADSAEGSGTEGSAAVPSGEGEDPAAESGGSSADADAGTRRPSKAARARAGASS